MGIYPEQRFFSFFVPRAWKRNSSTVLRRMLSFPLAGVIVAGVIPIEKDRLCEKWFGRRAASGAVCRRPPMDPELLRVNFLVGSCATAVLGPIVLN